MKYADLPPVRGLTFHADVPAIGLLAGDRLCVAGGEAFLVRAVPMEIARGYGLTDADDLRPHLLPGLQVVRGGAR